MGTCDVNAIPKRFGLSMDTMDERHDSPDDSVQTSQLKVGVQIEGSKEVNQKRKTRLSHAPMLATQSDRRRSTMVLGKDVYTDEFLEWRVKWAERGVGICCFLGVLSFFGASVSGSLPFFITTAVFALAGVACFVVLYYKNLSFLTMKRLLKEPNVIFIVILTICNSIIEIFFPTSDFSAFNSFAYFLIINAFVFVDAIILKSRYMLIGVGFILVGLSLYNAYGNTFDKWNAGIILVRYSIGSNTYTIEKRDTLRSIFLQILIFSLNAVYTMCVDKKMELMLFATGHIYRKKVAGLQNRSAQLEFRVKWLQRGAMLLIVVGVACYSIATTGVDYNYNLRYATIWIGACGQMCFFGLCYNNISLDLVKSLFKDPTVTIVIASCIVNTIIQIVLPWKPLSPVMGFIFLFCVVSFIALDTFICRGRYFLIFMASIYCILCIINMYGCTFGDWDVGVTLFQYKIDGQKYTISKRAVQRAIYVQVFLMCTNGILTLLTDTKMEKMSFSVGPIYKTTGTSSPYVYDTLTRDLEEAENVPEKKIKVQV